MDLFRRLRHIRDYARVKGLAFNVNEPGVSEALKLLSAEHFSQESPNRRPSIPPEVRREVWRRDQGKCVRCGSRQNLEFDHIIPVAKGGSSTVRNIELLCESCNRSKQANIE